MAETPQKVEPTGVSEIRSPDLQQKANPPNVEEPLLHDLSSRLDELQAGASIGIPGSAAATLSMFVEDLQSDSLMLLTVGKILGEAGTSAAGAAIFWEPGTPVLQPGLVDGGTISDQIAKVERVVLNEFCDAGVAVLIDQRRHSALLPDGSEIFGVAAPRSEVRAALATVKKKPAPAEPKSPTLRFHSRR